MLFWAEDAAVTNLLPDLSCLKKVCETSLVIKGERGEPSLAGCKSSSLGFLFPIAASSDMSLAKEQREKTNSCGALIRKCFVSIISVIVFHLYILFLLYMQIEVWILQFHSMCFTLIKYFYIKLSSFYTLKSDQNNKSLTIQKTLKAVIMYSTHALFCISYYNPATY